MNDIKMGSLFDGSAGFPLAAVMNGMIAVWASEVEPYPIRVTTKRLPFMKHYGDICQMNGAEVEPVDVITGGSPCQDMSVAGKRAGLDGERSGLFREQIRIIKEMREASDGKYPRFMVWENVPGALSSNKGADFKCVLEETARIKVPGFDVPMPNKGKWGTAGLIVDEEIGFSIGWRILDAQYWGVPQRRRRIFLVADFSGTSSEEILFKREGLSWHFAKSREAWQTATRSFKTGADETGWNPIYSIDREAMNAGYEFDRAPGIDESETAYTLKAAGPGGVALPLAYEWHNQDSRITGPIDTAYTLNTQAGGKEGHLVCETPCPENYLFENHSQDTRYIGPLDVAQTVSATYGMGGNNQPFVVENQVPMTMQIRCGCEGGGKGPLIQENKSATLSTQNNQTLFCMATQQGGAEIAENLSPTITAAAGMSGNNQPVLCVSRTHGISVSEDVVQTIQAAAGESGNNQPMICEPIPIQDQAISNGSGNGNGIAEPEDPMYTLMAETHHGVAYSLQGNMIGRSDKNGPQGSGINDDVNFTLNATDVHGVCTEEPITLHGNNVASTLMARDFKGVGRWDTLGSVVYVPDYIVRRLMPLECARLQGFPDWWTANLGTKEEDITEEMMIFWREVFETHRKVVTGVSKPKTDNQIRKWLINPDSDSAEYKMWGNGVALPCVLYVMEGVAEVLIKEKEGR